MSRKSSQTEFEPTSLGDVNFEPYDGKLIDLKDFRARFTREINHATSYMTAFEIFGRTEERQKEIDGICNVANLKCELEPNFVTNFDYYKTGPSVELECMGSYLRRERKQSTSADHNRNTHVNFANPDDSSTEQKIGDKVNQDDIVVTIDVLSMEGLKQEQIDLLGSQKLSDLRDVIYCMKDILPYHSVNKHSGFFCIENVFYDDTRDPFAKDYSSEIIHWAHQAGLPNAPEMRKLNMQDVPFNDVKVKLGFPYLYQHIGDCQHIIKFVKVRLLHPSDCQYLNSYPQRLFKKRYPKKECSICKLFHAKKVTYNDRFALENPCFFCDRCFDPIHLDEIGNMLPQAADFRYYDYFHDD